MKLKIILALVVSTISGSNCRCEQTHQGHGNAHGSGHGAHSPTSQNPFLKMMDSMMVAMDAPKLSASVERNFLLQMLPHHQGALDMAKYEIANGKNPEMIQLAKSILAEQQGEILEMTALLKSYPEITGDVPQAYSDAMMKSMKKMMVNTPSDAKLPSDNVDACFALVMLPHHQAAVDMSLVLLSLCPEGSIANYAKRIVANQQAEIEQMLEFIKK